jgi:hypothetical protein
MVSITVYDGISDILPGTNAEASAWDTEIITKDPIGIS